jgi:hypothetical protein
MGRQGSLFALTPEHVIFTDTYIEYKCMRVITYVLYF